MNPAGDRIVRHLEKFRHLLLRQPERLSLKERESLLNKLESLFSKLSFR